MMDWGALTPASTPARQPRIGHGGKVTHIGGDTSGALSPTHEKGPPHPWSGPASSFPFVLLDLMTC